MVVLNSLPCPKRKDQITEEMEIEEKDKIVKLIKTINSIKDNFLTRFPKS